MSPDLAGAPALRPRRSLRGIMGLTLLALLPGVTASIFFSGPSLLLQIVLAVVLALALEATMLKLRGKPLQPFISDLSAPLAAVLFALCLPPLTPWWLAAIGMIAAIAVGKHLYGGLGHNLFNPAMVGVAVVLVCFPFESSHGLPATGEWIASAYVLGGLFLLWKKIIPWQTPCAVIAATFAISLLLWLFDPIVYSSPLSQVFSSGLMLVAFFIATDPVSGSCTPRGRLLFGAGVAFFILAIRQWGNWPDGMAFAVLLMNCVAPLIDTMTRPRYKDEGLAMDEDVRH